MSAQTPQGARAPPVATQGLRRRLVSIILGRFLRANKRVNLVQLQREYGATRGKIVEAHIEDLDLWFYLRIRDGNVEALQPRLACQACGHTMPVQQVYPAVLCKCGEPAGTVPSPADVAGGFTTRSDVLISLWNGRVRVEDPRGGAPAWEEYGPMKAFRLGHVTVWGEATANEMLLFREVFQRYGRVVLGENEAKDASNANPGGPA